MAGTGPVPAPLAIVSDAPLGSDLDHYLTPLKLTRSQIFCTTLGSEDELWLELEMVEPDLIVTIGSRAMQTVLRDPSLRLEETRGLVFDAHGLRIFPVYQMTTRPSDPLQQAFLRHDFERLALYLKVSGLHPSSAVRQISRTG